MPIQRPIDLKRNAAFLGMAGVEGEGQVRELLSIGHSLLIIKDQAIYKLQLSDQVDPGRTNPDIPHVQQKLYSVGAASEVVGRVLMTAKYLFKDGLLDGRFDKEQLLSAALDFFDEIIAAVSLNESLRSAQTAAVAMFKGKEAEGSMLLLPSVPNVLGTTKSFIQRCDHAIQKLLSLCKIFYPLPTGRAWFDSLSEIVEQDELLSEEAIDRLKQITRYARFVRNCRHCIEHPNRDQKLIVSDFKMTAAAVIDPPMIEVIHRETPEPPVPVNVFMHGMTSSILAIGEELMSLLADTHVAPGWEDKIAVIEFPKEERRHPDVRFYFAMNVNGSLVPFG